MSSWFNYIIIKRDVLIEDHDSYRQVAQQEGSQDHPWLAHDGGIRSIQKTSASQR